MNNFFSTAIPILHQLFPQYAAYLTVAGLSGFSYVGVKVFRYVYGKYLLASNSQATDASNQLLYGACIFFSALGVLIAVLLSGKLYDTTTLITAVVTVHLAATAVYATEKYTIKPTLKVISNGK